ncbi:PEP-CTERM/exosortase system-associated acyltransferase [Aestuariibacter sp. AA17]|uniref:PEP-CTERM/exosortase system-associated acyltransferase n=1 Tax=Fluctibacter corallii TaxID=2984329 RepID=A0ABT3ACK2_9ALTE|nr:PEP-CTERM/exosortase system-associated acyltransferase [Aestuariibacter sp. AA17]MCV2886012.1 PEP-CTERM/exosortase system-associated acyltransferase [Aestuariibacter sp. AA17]
MLTNTLAQNFFSYFEVVIADTKDLREESYRIRHNVYSQELGWEPTTESGFETDECDGYAIPLLLKHKTSGQFAGTVRLVVPPKDQLEKQLPFELHCIESVRKDLVDPKQLERGMFGEISRLAVPATFRKRKGEQEQAFIINDMQHPPPFTEDERRNFPNIAIGLYLSVIAMCDLLGHSHMFVVVEPRLARRLSRLGINFTQVGNELDYHGIRALFVLERENFSSKLSVEMLEMYVLVKSSMQSQMTALNML